MSSDPDRQVRPFAAFLQEQRGGLTHSELSDALAEVTAAVLETGKAGSVTVTLKIKPAGKGDASMVFVTDTVATKVPRADRAETLFFADSAGNLARKDPRQTELPLRVAGARGPGEADDNPAREAAR